MIKEPKSNNETVSVIMSVYNCAETVSEAIESILNQTYSDIQFIICNDCSTDNTAEIVKDYAKKDSRIVFIENEKNMRLPYSLNHCLKYVSGKYVARMDGDDISKPERFEKELEYIKSHPEYNLVGCAMQRFSNEGLADIVYAVDSPDYYTLKNRIPFHHATILTYKTVYDRLGGYTVSERTARCEDYDLWFRFYSAGFNGNSLKEPLYLVREDAQAIRRRTFKTRWNAFKTTKVGFDLLNYPKTWLIKPALKMIFKSLVPFKAIEFYRRWQSKRKKSQGVNQ